MRRFPAGGYLLGYLLVVTAVITLAPFRFAGPVEPRLAWLVNPGDVVANVLLFVPLGFLYRISAHPAARPGHWPTIGAALLVSATLETLQIFLPGRYPSPVDVLSNTLGAGLGSWLHARIAAHLDGRLVRGLALELPLMNVVYLLVPTRGGSCSRRSWGWPAPSCWPRSGAIGWPSAACCRRRGWPGWPRAGTWSAPRPA